MGLVFDAVDRITGDRVAVKVIVAESAHQLDSMHRFLREAAASASVSHPGVVSARHVDLAQGRLFLVFPFVEGESLDRVLARVGRLEIARAARIAGSIADALAAAHAVGVVHRDIKPANVMLTAEGEVRVLDFGISKLHDGSLVDSDATREGVILGTPAYMAPEQVTDAKSTRAPADVYSLGIMLFEMIAGKLPFPDPEPRSVMAAHVLREPPLLAVVAPPTPRSLSEAVDGCLAKNPERRPTAIGLRDAIRALEPDVGSLGLAEPLPGFEEGPGRVAKDDSGDRTEVSP
jgi:eukaryotic-like serine/threonine-protein kinase